ncbi:MAG TPA: OmpW family protein [Parvularculaceae bacterium]|nr:OmpW family protein [Amphiplicatus sp.]HOP20502.1 OmpW family protein [Amphiplicatus sp.]HPE31795.1 OmpW family protein [Parvularculaceae bacterium]
MKNTACALALLALATTPAAAEQGDWLVRLRGIIVAPTEESTGVQPTFPTGTVSVDNAIVPELDFTYFLTNNIGAELILATTPHDISGEGALAGLGEIADTMVLPPTLTLQYHFNPAGKIRPYAGVGVNWTIFYNEDTKAALNDAIGATTIDLENSVGVAYQVGVDFDLTERFFMNFDVKYIQIDTTATLNTGGLINTVDVDLDPIVAGIGFGMRF